ncbi:hypothetical protein BC351_10375 [Paenibacillus ferrarius]|uniref:HTH LytTR-type domain-containing protein n=1 Tax=Paenibacillus ferrarius TaxID=1469647 RepID=A0A1V4H8V0_9BACL|nr:hypothetical protein [Paenibacillus ferrarius]OPH47588.1 hypothetical protein BC351_10375 [Paenibacillus ferrarius]
MLQRLTELLNQLRSSDVEEEVIEDIANIINDRKTLLVTNEKTKVAEWLPINEILYVECTRTTKAVITTKTDTYIYVHKEIDIIEMLTQMKNFVVAHSKVLINMDKVLYYDSFKYWAVFSEEFSDSKDLIFTQVYAKFIDSALKPALGKEKDISDMKTLSATKINVLLH